MSSGFPFPIHFKSNNGHTSNNDNSNNDNSNNDNSNNDNSNNDNSNNDNSNNNNGDADNNNNNNNNCAKPTIAIIELPISKSDHISTELHKELLDLAIAEQKKVYANFKVIEGLLEQYHLFDSSFLKINIEINKKTCELIEWESGVLFVREDAIPDKTERELEEQSIVEGIKERLGQLFYQKAHIEQVRKEMQRKINFNKHLRQSAADELESILSKLALWRNSSK